MPTLALTYFDMPGRARVLRKALALGGVAFDDRALPSDQIRALKPSTPYGMVPILAIDGEPLAESQAIFRYIGRLTGMYPPATEPLAAAMTDEIIDSLDDINERLLIPTYQEDDVDKRKEMRLRLIAGPLRRALELLDARLRQIQQLPFFVDHPEWLFIHELLVWDYATKLRSDGLDHIPATFVDAFATIVAVFDKVENKSSVADQRPPVVLGESIVSPPPKLKLTHFNAPERADPLRLALHIGGIAFEDERVSEEEFSKRRHEFPNGQLPVLAVGDQIVAQSFSILRYAGTLGGLYPVGDTLAAAKIDEVLSHIGELYYFFDPEFQDQRPEEKESVRQALVEDVVPESLEALDKRLTYWNKTAVHFAMGGDTLTIADLAIYGLVELLTSDKLEYMPNTVVTPHKNVLRSHEVVRKHPRVQDWFAKVER